jgi:ComF family protein
MPVARFGMDVINGRLCLGCISGANHRFTRARAAGNFGGTLRTAIHRLKYDGRHGMGFLLGEWARRAGGAEIFPRQPPDMVVPVPLHPTRHRSRGFNQSFLIAQGMVGDRGWPIVPEALARVRNTRPQVSMPAEQRAANVAGAFAAPDPEIVRGKRILIVDDVLTTLHTVNECAGVLLEAGAAEVHVAAVAR